MLSGIVLSSPVIEKIHTIINIDTPSAYKSCDNSCTYSNNGRCLYLTGLFELMSDVFKSGERLYPICLSATKTG